MGTTDYVPIHALFDTSGIEPNWEDDPRPMLRSADLIFGVDIMSGRQFLVFGRERLERMVRTRKAERCRVLRIGIDQETDELERLVALVQVMRGQHDYESSSPS
jgi:hypothetical protein